MCWETREATSPLQLSAPTLTPLRANLPISTQIPPQKKQVYSFGGELNLIENKTQALGRAMSMDEGFEVRRWDSLSSTVCPEVLSCLCLLRFLFYEMECVLIVSSFNFYTACDLVQTESWTLNSFLMGDGVRKRGTCQAIKHLCTPRKKDVSSFPRNCKTVFLWKPLKAMLQWDLRQKYARFLEKVCFRCTYVHCNLQKNPWHGCTE